MMKSCIDGSNKKCGVYSETKRMESFLKKVSQERVENNAFIYDINGRELKKFKLDYRK